MSLESALLTLVTGDATVSGLIGTRMYPDRLPVSPTLPALAYTFATLVETSAHGRDVAFEEVGVQYRVHAATRTDAVVLRDALRDAIRDYRGTVGSEQIERIKIANVINDYDPGNDDYQVIVDTVVQHVRSA